MIKNKSGIEFEPIHTNSWAKAVLLAQKHKVDMYSAVPYDEKRARYMDFTKNDIFRYNACFVTQKDKKNLAKTISKDTTIAIVKSSSLGNFIKSKYPNAHYIEVDKTKDGFKGLQKGLYDLFAINSATASYMINKKGFKDLVVAQKIDYIFKLKIAISKTMPKEVISIIDKTLGSITQKEIDTIYDKWMEPVIIKEKVDWKILFYISIFIVILTIFFLYKQYTMKKSLEEFGEVIDATMEGILIFKNDICVDLNKSTLDILGYTSKDELIGKNALELVDDSSKQLVKSNTIKRYNKPYEITLVKKDNTTLDAIIQGKYLKNKKLQLVSIIDITDIKQKDQLLIQQSKLAAMGEMIGNIAHQWRQPLSVISTSVTGMIVQKECNMLDDKQFFKMCEHINDMTQFLSKTIDDFSNFIDDSREKTIFSLKDSVDEFLSIVDGPRKQNDIKMVFDIDESILIDGYQNELIQSYINIFNNSKDVFLEKELDEKLFFINVKKEDGSAIIELIDNAQGIPEDILPKIFEPYFTTKHQSQGTGLGLHTTYNFIVNRAKGSIDAKNIEYTYKEKRYRGAKITIILPINN